ncbi:MAG: DUF1294 domain-containing protein [Clostridia bacterium]|nr:DUF1294 domain-containing protein [Clostridia bacterium]
MGIIEYIYFIFLAVVSVITFFAYLIDKAKAKRNAWRIPEKVLLGLGFCGGAVGALVSMKLARHKTKHVYFWVINVLGLVWQVTVAVLLSTVI